MRIPVHPEDPECVARDCRDAAELGLASLIMGAALLLAAPITMILAVLVWRFADDNAFIDLVHASLTRAAILIGLLVGIASIAFGAGGVRLRKRHRRRAGIALAGVLLGLAASAAWLIASILLVTTDSLGR